MNKMLLDGFYNTQPLWEHEQFGIPQFKMPKLNNFPIEMEPLADNLRLGHQMEYVFKTLIQTSRQYEMLFSNMLIEEGKQRLGELDFLLREISTKQVVHVELAYKFYIIDPDIPEPIYRLMGPNKRDMFHTKLDKLKSKQFPLLYHPSLKSHWKALQIEPTAINQAACFKAQLFKSYGEENVHIRPLNTACLSGEWIRFDDFNQVAFAKWQFYIPRKQQWVIKPQENVGWMDHFDTLMETNVRMLKENAPMLWAKRPDGAIEKWFVVWW